MDERIDIVTENDYLKALDRFLELCGSEKTGEELKELLLLIDLMEKYERENCGGS
ncbi:MAG: hypothetical protein PHN68_07745 [Prolixibacteraceae bacterium]|jgi:hypothetical protein|nr:hypothetical protein [Prolixibacteraceae bacterium]MDD4755956.1 hypothetical protein [Prolixibacteraceae bacterium]NLO01093.1 hypothetical protein [Bacteroidales bacterium]